MTHKKDMVEDQFGKDIYLNEYTNYTKDDFISLTEQLVGLLDEAEESGFEEPFVQFRSTLEAYEDNSPGPVEVQIRGHRELNEKEKHDQAERKRVQELATKIGVTFYEASILDNLEKQSKIKL